MSRVIRPASDRGSGVRRCDRCSTAAAQWRCPSAPKHEAHGGGYRPSRLACARKAPRLNSPQANTFYPYFPSRPGGGEGGFFLQSCCPLPSGAIHPAMGEGLQAGRHVPDDRRVGERSTAEVLPFDQDFVPVGVTLERISRNTQSQCSGTRRQPAGPGDGGGRH